MRFNKRKGHAFILETGDAPLVCYSDRRHAAAGRKLVTLQYGKRILKGCGAAIKGRSMKAMLKAAEQLNRKGVQWDHHLLFPKCMFNRHKGKWCIMFEGDGRIIESVSAKSPLRI